VNGNAAAKTCLDDWCFDNSRFWGTSDCQALQQGSFGELHHPNFAPNTALVWPLSWPSAIACWKPNDGHESMMVNCYCRWTFVRWPEI